MSFKNKIKSIKVYLLPFGIYQIQKTSSISIEGMRPILIDIRALVSSAVYGAQKRSTIGLDPRRLNMLLEYWRNEDVAINQEIAFAAEVGLSGEIRSVNHIEQRISEAEKLGFESIVVSKYNGKNIQNNKAIRVVAVSKIEEVFRFVFG